MSGRSFKTEKRKRAGRFVGAFELPGNPGSIGELQLTGPNIHLKLHGNSPFPFIGGHPHIYGHAFTGERLSLIQCLTASTTGSGMAPTSAQHQADIIPHYAAVGRVHLDPDKELISEIHLATRDLNTQCHDFDAFGYVADPRAIIDTIVLGNDGKPIHEVGENPKVFYFSGKETIAEVSTAIGIVAIRHRPRYSFQGTTGFFMKNGIFMSIRPVRNLNFWDACNSISKALGFIWMIAGRPQKIRSFHLTTSLIIGGIQQLVEIYPRYQWYSDCEPDRGKLNRFDMPLDPIRHRPEFEAVLSRWIERDGRWRASRVRYFGCLSHGSYDPERLIAAANMFDILPEEAVPSSSELSSELAATRDRCTELFRQHPRGIDRDSALSALGRLGKPSLPKKVAYRVSIVEKAVEGKFPDLGFVAGLAVKCRNFFVHGARVC